jgi:hypothetical protein
MLLWLKKFAGRAELSKPLPHSTALSKFCEVFDAHPERSERKFYRRFRLDYTDYNDPNIHYKTETVDAVAIHIPIYKLDDFLGSVSERQYKEMEIRDNVPAVKLAYERYQILLKMCGGDFDARY